MKTLQGSITISRPMGGSDQPPMTIELRDENSRLKWLEISINPGDFMLALTGMGETPVVAEIRDQAIPMLGMMHQIKHIMLEGVDYRNFTQTFLEAIQPYEEDGWKHSSYEANHHNSHHSVSSDGKRLYKAALTRYVPVQEEVSE